MAATPLPPHDDLLLTQATLFASTNPCSLFRRDMPEFVRRAGLDERSPIMQTVAAQPSRLVVTSNTGMKEFVRLAEGRTSMLLEEMQGGVWCAVVVSVGALILGCGMILSLMQKRSLLE